MATAIRPIGHEERLSLVDHLDELRTRLIVCVLALSLAFAFSFWQNHALLNIVNRPLENSTRSAARHAHGPLAAAARFDVKLRTSLERNEQAFRSLARTQTPIAPAERSALLAAAQASHEALKAAPRRHAGRQPVTLGLGEPFSQTLTVSFYFAVLLAFPLLLWQAYAFVLPAFSPRERRIALPLMAMAPVLFAAGVLFGYFLVLPAAIGFLQTFNTGEFDVLVQARSLYTFSLLTLVTMGVLFQLPVGVLALTRLGVVKPAQLRRHWRYAVVIIAVVAVLLPGTDPVTTTIEMVPMLMLYGLSILLASWAERYDRRSAEHDQDADADPD